MSLNDRIVRLIQERRFNDAIGLSIMKCRYSPIKLAVRVGYICISLCCLKQPLLAKDFLKELSEVKR